MMQRILFALAAFGPVSVHHAAISVTHTAGLGEYAVADSGGTPLDDGNAVRIGSFDSAFVTGGGLNGLDLGDLATLDANFTLFHETAVTTLTAGPTTQPGSFSDTGSSSSATFDGEKIYLWVFDTSDDLAPDLTFSNVGEYGLFSSNIAAWTFPNQTDTFPTTTINTTQVNESFVGEVDTTNSQLLTAVPEPARVGALLGIAALGLTLLRRRQRAL